MTALAARGHGRPVEALLSRLSRVREVGPGKWIASTPTREDKHPSLSVREMPDGRVLVHDFGGNSAVEVMASIGLALSDLYPAPIGHHLPKARVAFPALPVLRALSLEAGVVFQCGAKMLSGAALSDEDAIRLMTAIERIDAGLRIAEGRA